jgi:hypothetical protein
MTVNSKRVGFNILTLDEKDNVISYKSLQYFPESLRDSKSVDYSRKAMPGGSLPIYQWVSGGARTLSLTAILSCDNDLSDINTGVVNSFMKLEDLNSKGLQRNNIDIRSAVVWLRQHLYPRYSQNQQTPSGYQVSAPRKVFLNIPNSGIGFAGMGSLSRPDSVLCIMTQCEVDYKSFFPNGLPRLASIQLSFEEVAQYQGLITFPAASKGLDALYEQRGLYSDAPDNYRRYEVGSKGTIVGGG